MIFIEAVGGALVLLFIVENYATVLNSMARIHIADWRKGAGTDGVHVPPSIFHFND